ncbi:aceric acid hydrolase [Mangrovibacterium lignilyticum]|uniref:aceric acid hydrolase n=1 Tax=Mangrovibacterium lignilyticum TaxID=2668052 RepID=UPI0013D60DDC|nr:glycoside hydrolase family 127 protein [Mangrovibacterium lignilyticum]
MVKRYFVTPVLLVLVTFQLAQAQDKSLVNTSKSKFAKLESVNLTDVRWTTGFWADRYQVCAKSMMPHMLDMYLNDSISHGYANFEIAAGLKDGEHIGPPFHDGDFYKMLEAAIVVAAETNDQQLDQKIDSIIAVIGMTQRADGYIHTPVMINEREHPEKKAEFAERMDFETYNMGHLMTAASVHYRLTGKMNLMDIAIKATDFLFKYYEEHAYELAQNAICPSHYMGVTEMYRTLGDPRYLELAQGLIDIRDQVDNGHDHNQDRIPFRQQTKAEGHAVRANYLYAGAADVYAETGDESLMKALDAIWHDLVENKLYITGACGALYDGVSPNGTTYDQPSIQQVHQAYGEDYQLPNLTAHNESCANIGNLLWNYRMLQVTADAKYADVMEQVMYNSLLAAISLDGIRHFYTNPLAVADEVSPDLRWSKDREPYISYCNCCPPNTIRTIAEINNYMYSLSNDGLYVNFYGANELNTTLENGDVLQLNQETDYPWDGAVELDVQKTLKNEMTLHLRIPAWCPGAELKVNGQPVSEKVQAGTYVAVSRKWKKGDQISLNLPMPVQLMEANPMVEETRGLVAVQRGPVVYCVETADLPNAVDVFNVAVDAATQLKPEAIEIDGARMLALKGEGVVLTGNSWKNKLYQPINSVQPAERIPLKFVPYYAWDNRGRGEMSVWIPVRR